MIQIKIISDLKSLFHLSFKYAICSFIIILYLVNCIDGHSASKSLYEDLFSDYNRLIRPSKNHSYKVTVNVGLKLAQLIELVMTTNLWLEQNWYDYKLSWMPQDYGGVEMLHVPAEDIWVPDIVLFNNFDGNYEVTLMTKATVYHNGLIVWNPPALYKSTCKIDVEYFPFDVQSCLMKFGSWTYDGHEVDLRHVRQEDGTDFVDVGIDMSEFYKSVEWDILMVPAKYNEEFFDCCPEPYPDITFNITIRRKTLFYTVNLIFPCVCISFLTLLVFYLPSDSGEKVTLSISILVALTVFFLLLAEIIPPSSLAVPLIGKYLLFTMILVTLSICITVGVLNVHFRTPSTHRMSPWVRTLFIHMMPRLLLMKRPSYHDWTEELAAVGSSSKTMARPCNGGSNGMPYRRESYKMMQKCNTNGSYRTDPIGYSSIAHEHLETFEDDIPVPTPELLYHGSNIDGEFLPPLIGSSYYNRDRRVNWCCDRVGVSNDPLLVTSHQFSPEVKTAIESILLIADHIKKDDEENNVIEDWKYVAMVLDRLFLWIFTLAVICGTCGIILQAPSLYDPRQSLDQQLSTIALGLGSAFKTKPYQST